MNQIIITLPKPFGLQKEIIDHDSRFKVVCAGRRVGKSTLCKLLTINKILNGNRIAYLTPEYGLAEKFYEEIISYFSEELITKKNKSRLNAKFITNGEIKFFSGEALERVRSWEFDYLIVDEAAYIPDLEKEWLKSLRPLLIKTRGGAIFISTPNGKNYFYSLFQKGFNNDKDYKSWKFSSFENPYLPKEELDDLVDSMPEANYRQEILAEPGENISNPFGTAAIDRNTIETLSSSQPIVIAADLARVNDYTVILGLDESGNMCYFDRFQMPWELTINKLKEVRNKFPYCQIILDSTGVGSVILERAQQEIYNVIGFEFTSSSKPKVIHSLIKSVELNQIKFNKTTANEMHTYIFKYSSSGNLKYEAASGFHDDTIAALAMANNFRRSYSMSENLHIF
jgi:hypothetical protein